MATASTSPELPQGEPHPAVRLAEAICALIAAIAGPSWFWRFLPGGRAFWEGMHQLSRDFAALMHRLAAAPPTPPAPVGLAPKRRRSTRTGEVRPRHGVRRRPRSIPTAPTPRMRAARPAPDHTPPMPRVPIAMPHPASTRPAQSSISKSSESPARETRAHFVTIT